MTDVQAGSMQPLEGVTVLELSRVLTGPYAAMLLGDMGARVIKVERPGTGDDTRAWGPPFIGEGSTKTSTYFLSVNRNKESIALDLKDSDDLKILESLIVKADIVVENFRTGVLDRLGLGHERMQRLNPRLIIMSITGFGHDGPQAQRPGYDQIVQGEAGLMSVTGPTPDCPTKVGLPIADLSAGMFGVIGALAALQERARTGSGRIVHTSLLSAIVGLHTFQGARWLIAGDMPYGSGNAHPTVAPYGAYLVGDEKIVQVAVGNESIWSRFRDFIGIDPNDERFLDNSSRLEHSVSLNKIIEQVFACFTSDDLITELEHLNIPCGLVKSMKDVYEDEQVLQQGMLLSTDHPTFGNLKTPGNPIRWDKLESNNHHRPPPELDQHGSSIKNWVKN